jgi:ankyrin repeat protein
VTENDSVRSAVADISNDDQASLIRLAANDPTCDRDPHLLQLLFKGGMRLRSDETFRSILSQALRYQSDPIIQALLDHEAQFGPFTTNALHDAVNRGSISAVKTLLDSGADFDACMIATASSRTMRGGRHDSFLEVPGHGACLAVAEDVSSFGGSPYKELAEHLTAFQYAALIGQEEIICLFLAHAANPSVVPSGCHEFEIPMYLAALLGRHAIVSHLLKDARWLACPDSDIWQNALCAAAHAGHNETLKTLLADQPHMRTRGAPPAPYDIEQVPPGESLLLASYEDDMQAQGTLPAYFEEAIQNTIHIGREETLKILLDFLDASSPHLRAQGRKTLSHALGRAEIRRFESLDGLARILREKGATLPGGEDSYVWF